MRRSLLSAALLLGILALSAPAHAVITAPNQTPLQMTCWVVGSTDSHGVTTYGLACKDNTGVFWTCGRSGSRITCTSEGDPAPCPANPFLCAGSTDHGTVETVWVPTALLPQNQYGGSLEERQPGGRHGHGQTPKLPQEQAVDDGAPSRAAIVDELDCNIAGCDGAYHLQVNTCRATCKPRQGFSGCAPEGAQLCYDKAAGDFTSCVLGVATGDLSFPSCIEP